MIAWLAATGLGLAAALLVRPRPRWDAPATTVVVAAAVPDGWLRRYRLAWSVLGGLGAAVFVGGVAGVALAPVAGAAVWATATRSEPVAVRRRREQVRRDLPPLVLLLAAALRSGASPAEALAVAARALPGAAAERLDALGDRLALGVPPATVWADLASDPELAPLGRTMARAHQTGAPVVAAVERLADELARAARAEVEDRARAVGVRAAVPLGLCLLPSFVLVGIVPLVAALLTTVVRA